MRKFWILVLGCGLSMGGWACSENTPQTLIPAVPLPSTQAGMSGSSGTTSGNAGGRSAGGSSAGTSGIGGAATGGSAGAAGPEMCLWTVCEPGLKCCNGGCGVCGPPGGACPTPIEKPCGGAPIGDEVRCNDFVACPGVGNTCMDKPGDECDPNNGGKDCVRICKCTMNTSCGPGFAFSTEDAICACAPIGTVGTTGGSGGSSGTGGSAGSSGASGSGSNAAGTGNGGSGGSRAGAGGA